MVEQLPLLKMANGKCDVAGKFPKQSHFFVMEKMGNLGMQLENANDPAFKHQGEYGK